MADPAQVPIEHQLVVRALMGKAFGGGSADRLALMSRETFFPAGKVIYRAGDAPRHVHFVVQGQVELAADGSEPWVLSGRGVFGVLDTELDRPHARTARALTDVRVISIRAEDWLDLVEDTFEFTRRRIRNNAEDLLRRGLSLSPHGGFVGMAPSHRRDEQLAPLVDLGEAGPFERLLVLHLTDVFERAGIQALIRLAAGATEVEATPGRVLVTEGEAARSILVVAAGEVEIARREPLIEAPFGVGRLVGGYAGIGHVRWPVSVHARGDARVLSIDYEDLFDVMEDHFDLVRSVMAFLAHERLRLQSLKW